MLDRFGDVISKDLAQIPLPPPERWTRAAQRRDSRGALGVRMGLAAALLIGALAAPAVVGAVRDLQVSQVANPGGADVPGRISRAAALAAVRQLSLELPVIKTMRAKLVTSGASSVIAPGTTMTFAPRPVWIVAVSGEVRSAYGVAPRAPFRSGLYVLDALSGAVLSMQASNDLWPSSFDALPDASLAADTRSFLAVVTAVSDSGLQVRANSTELTGRAIDLAIDADSEYEAADGHTVFGLSELELRPGMEVIVVAGPVPAGVWRLEAVRRR